MKTLLFNLNGNIKKDLLDFETCQTFLYLNNNFKLNNIQKEDLKIKDINKKQNIFKHEK